MKMALTNVSRSLDLLDLDRDARRMLTTMGGGEEALNTDFLDAARPVIEKLGDIGGDASSFDDFLTQLDDSGFTQKQIQEFVDAAKRTYDSSGDGRVTGDEFDALRKDLKGIQGTIKEYEASEQHEFGGDWEALVAYVLGAGKRKAEEEQAVQSIQRANYRGSISGGGGGGPAPTISPQSVGSQTPVELPADFKSLPPDQQLAKLKELQSAHGGKYDPNGPNLVVLRDRDASGEHGADGAYNDVAVVFSERNGQPEIKTFAANADPASNFRYASAGGDMGRAVQGTRTFDVHSDYKGGRAWKPIGGNMGVERESGRTTGGAESMLGHVGGDNSTWSAGCFTARPADWAAINAHLDSFGARKVDMTIVNIS
jgi:hypothetical protein